MTTRRTSTPAALPVTLDDLKRHLRVTSADEDAYLTRLIDAAVSEIEALSSRCVAPAEYTLYASPPKGMDVFLEITPALAITSISVIRPEGQKASLDETAFLLSEHPDRPSVSGDWGSLAARADAVQITYSAGYGPTPADTPADLVHAITLLAAHRFEVREDVVIGTITSPVPRSIDHLVSLHRVRTFG